MSSGLHQGKESPVRDWAWLSLAWVNDTTMPDYLTQHDLNSLVSQVNFELPETLGHSFWSEWFVLGVFHGLIVRTGSLLLRWTICSQYISWGHCERRSREAQCYSVTWGAWVTLSSYPSLASPKQRFSSWAQGNEFASESMWPTWANLVFSSGGLHGPKQKRGKCCGNWLQP